ncbi:MAG: hypothetical protein WBA46_01815 [Thermomicrobiales bacterium]
MTTTRRPTIGKTVALHRFDADTPTTYAALLPDGSLGQPYATREEAEASRPTIAERFAGTSDQWQALMQEAENSCYTEDRQPGPAPEEWLLFGTQESWEDYFHDYNDESQRTTCHACHDTGYLLDSTGDSVPCDVCAPAWPTGSHVCNPCNGTGILRTITGKTYCHHCQASGFVSPQPDPDDMTNPPF